MRQRHALGLLFSFLGIALVLIALAAVEAGQWVVAFGAAVLGGWLGVDGIGAFGDAAEARVRREAAYSLTVAATEDTGALWKEYRRHGIVPFATA